MSSAIVRLVALDLDGTLLNSAGKVSDRTVEAMQKLRGRGCHLVYVTARPPRFVKQLALDTSVDCIAICANGAVVYDSASDCILRIIGLQPAVSTYLVETLRQKAPGVSFACEVGMRFGREPRYVPRGEELPDCGQLVADAIEFCQEPLNKLLVRHPSLPLASLFEVASGVTAEGVSITRSTDEFLEIAAHGVNKALTLSDQCSRIDVSKEEVLAIGDMPNDIPMLQWAGHGVAMANAHPTVLNVAQQVTLSNDAEGVALILEGVLAHASS